MAVELWQLLVKQLSMLWCFINTCFIYFWTYVHKGQTHRYEFSDFLQWRMEEVRKMQKVLNENEMLNKLQCMSLFTELCKTTESIIEMITLTKKSSKFMFVVVELQHIIQKVGVLVTECGRRDWCHAALFQINNKEAFRELVLDLKCCRDATYEIYLTSHPDPQKYTCIDLNLATFKEVEDDEHELETRLESVLENSKDYELAKYLLRRLRELQRVEGAELDDLEIPIDFWKPTNLEKLGSGGSGSVYRSKWLGQPSATKTLSVSTDPEHHHFRKEVGIIAGLSHPNLIKYFCCGIDEKNQKLYLVMELMEMSLNGMLKKRNKTLLPYVVAIDVMLQIGRGVLYLHDMHVAHLDLKPENVLLSSMTIDRAKDTPYHFNVKLIDYGTSKMEVKSKPQEQEVEHTLGTAKYMAPEANPNNLARMACPFQADVWSFAMTCSEILSLNVPFHGTELLREITKKLKECERPELPINCEELTELIEECWREDPLERPTFFDICKRLTNLEKKFMNGTYSNDMVPQFDGAGISLQKLSRTLKACKEVNNHASEKVFGSKVVGRENNIARVKADLEKVNSWGIIGMGGIGKTTLANAIVDKVKSTYDASCFVGQLKGRCSLEILLEILPKLGMDKNAENLMEAHKMMDELLFEKKVLLVLDNIEDQTQVDDIIPMDILDRSKGSTLIITTRDWGAIEHRVAKNGRIDVSTLDKNAANMLFNTYSSRDESHLPLEFDYVRDKIVEACKGLPLSLKIMGAFLRGKERLRSWERALQRMKRGRSLDGDDDGIWSTLRITFDDGLIEGEKSMFLDIACFFGNDVHSSGMSKERALRIWTDNGIAPVCALEKLVHRSLVTIENGNDDDDGFLQMHDHLRAMGQMIAEKEYKGTRIWNTNGFTNLDVKKIQGISYFGNLGSHNLPCTMQMKGGDLSYLRLLSFGQGDELDILEKILNIDNICSLVAHSSTLKCFMIDSLSKNETCLECKILMDSHLWKACAQLNVLQLRGCLFLESIPDEIFSITTLLELDLEGCSNLTRLSEKFGKSISLTSLNLSWCSSLTTIPEGLGNLASLTTLNLNGCKSLTRLPTKLGNLCTLRHMNLSMCSKLTKMLEGLGNLTSLTTLKLNGCKSLTTLELNGCTSLTTIPEGLLTLTSLITLKLSWFSSLTIIPDGLGNLTSLTILNLNGCKCLTTLPEELGKLIFLEILELFECSSLTTLPDGLGNLISLMSLDLSYCKRLTTLPEKLGNLSFLIHLDLSMCSRLRTIPEGLGNLTSLITLKLSWFSSMTIIPDGLGNLTSLTILNLNGCKCLTTLPEELGKLIFLETLELFECSSLTTLPDGLGNLTSLMSLDLSYCKRLTTLPEKLGNLSSLIHLDLFMCSRLRMIPEGLGNLTSLKTLNLFNCSSLTTLPDALGNLTSLTTLNFSKCSSLTSLPDGLGNLKLLITLELIDCSSLTKLPEGLGNLSSLTHLNLSMCSRLTTIPEGLENLTSLTNLNLSWCYSLTSIPEGLGNLTSTTRTVVLHHTRFPNGHHVK